MVHLKAAVELLPAGGQQLDVCGTHSSHSIKTSTHPRAPERRRDERSWRRPVRLADCRRSRATMGRDGISIQPPSEGELHANSRASRSGAGWAQRAAVLRVASAGDSRRKTCPSQNINNPKCGKAGRRNQGTPEIVISFWGRLRKLSCGTKTAFAHEIKAHFPRPTHQDGTTPVLPDSKHSPHDVLMASRSSAYFHLLSSYFLAPAAALEA